LFKRAGKQIRRSLKTTDPALARRRLGELRNKVARLNPTRGASRITFANLAIFAPFANPRKLAHRPKNRRAL